jgi:hypothetical protein
MADGEYDIFGNLIVAKQEITQEVKGPLFTVGDKVEVKEGGKVYRKATVIGCDKKGQQHLDLEYDDGEKELEVPISLIRLGSRVPGSASPPGMSSKTKEESTEGTTPEIGISTAPVHRKERRKKDPESIIPESKGSGQTSFSSKSRQCYELIKTFDDKEQEAALAMLLAFDSVRASKFTQNEDTSTIKIP